MTFSDWKTLPEEKRIELRDSWETYKEGYWHALNKEAVEHFRTEYGSNTEIRNIVGGVFHGGGLIIGVCTNIPWTQKLNLPEDYYGFYVVQLGTKTETQAPKSK